jgi:hypothetical protein
VGGELSRQEADGRQRQKLAENGMTRYYAAMRFRRACSNVAGEEYPSFEGTTADRAEFQEVMDWCGEHIGPGATSPSDFTERGTAWMYRKAGQAYCIAFNSEMSAFLFGNRWEAGCD